MRWQGRRGSDNVVDNTGAGEAPAKKTKTKSKGGGKGRSKGKGAVLGGGGLGAMLLAGLLYAFGLTTSDVEAVLGDGSAPAKATASEKASSSKKAGSDSAAVAKEKKFVSVVLADTEEVWTDLFEEQGETYVKPHLILYSGKMDSPCGMAEAAIGPFYCPPDENVYLDLDFFHELSQDLGAPGDFAEAYVIGHEIGHHVQNITGVLADVEKKQSAKRMSQKKKNDLDVRVELQADYYAGVWAHHAQKRFNILEEGDIDEALGAATAVGDDTLQKASQGYAAPDTFQHGSAAQRVRWFKKGFKRGDFKGGDTFSAKRL